MFTSCKHVIRNVKKKLMKQGTISKSRKTRRRGVGEVSIHFHVVFSKTQGLETGLLFIFGGLFGAGGFLFCIVLDWLT